jgi:hypothetical protein
MIKIGSAIVIRQSVAKSMPRLLKLNRSELNYRELVRKAAHLSVLTISINVHDRFGDFGLIAPHKELPR